MVFGRVPKICTISSSVKDGIDVVSEKNGGARNRYCVPKSTAKTVFHKANRKKQLEDDILKTDLERSLNTAHVAFMGIGHMVGGGIYVLTGEVAHAYAGPSVIVSYILAGFASVLAAFCYAEFGGRVPKAGSAFAFTHVSMGEVWAFMIGWDMALEYTIGGAAVAKSWSGTMDTITNKAIQNGTIEYVGTLGDIPIFDKYPDFVAMAALFVCAVLVLLGAKFSAVATGVLTCVNLGVIVIVAILACVYGDIKNWGEQYGGFFPAGFGGVVKGASQVFFAYVGFDTVAVCGEETKNPVKIIPRATMISMIVVMICYCTFSAALTILWPWTLLNPTAAAPEALSSLGIEWGKYVVTVGSLCGMTSTMFGQIYVLPRLLYAMASEGLIFKFFAKVNARTKVPIWSTIVSSLVCIVIASVLNMRTMVDLVSVGTLVSYTMVSLCVLLLRFKPPGNVKALVLQSMEGENGCLPPGTLKESFSSYFIFKKIASIHKGMCFIAMATFGCSCMALMIVLKFGIEELINAEWWIIIITIVLIITVIGSFVLLCAFKQTTVGLGFKVPLVPLIPGLSILCNCWLMTYLDGETWARFFVWMVLGLIVYFSYGIRHSKTGRLERQRLEDESANINGEINDTML